MMLLSQWKNIPASIVQENIVETKSGARTGKRTEKWANVSLKSKCAPPRRVGLIFGYIYSYIISHSIK